VESFARLTSTQLGRLDQYVGGDEGKQLLDETSNEVDKMLFRIKDFNSVYNIAEDRFKLNPTGIHIKVGLEEMKALIDQDLRNKNIDVNIRLAENIPLKITGDEAIYKQIMLNILTQNIAGCFRSVLTIQVEKVTEMGIDFLKIDIENFKSDIKRDEANELAEMCDFFNFLDVIEANVDINVKIAKILADKAMWQMKFTFSRGTKFCFMIPIDGAHMTRDLFDKARGNGKSDGMEQITLDQPTEGFTKVEHLPKIG